LAEPANESRFFEFAGMESSEILKAEFELIISESIRLFAEITIG
jgi:hypothetical protein